MDSKTFCFFYCSEIDLEDLECLKHYLILSYIVGLNFDPPVVKTYLPVSQLFPQGQDLGQVTRGHPLGPHPSSYFIPISSSRIHYPNVIMRRLKNAFRSRSETSDPAASRSVWPRRRQPSEGDPLKPQPEAASNELGDEPTTEAGPSANKPSGSAAVAPVDNTDNAETGSNAQHAQDTSELPSRSKNGTRRLKKMVARLRGSLSHEDDPITDTQPQAAQESSRKERPSSIPLSSNPVELDTTAGESSTAAGKSVRFDDPKSGRKVSAQTTHSQESSQTEDTICRDPARHIAMPIQEPLEEWGWPGLMLYYPDRKSVV